VFIDKDLTLTESILIDKPIVLKGIPAADKNPELKYSNNRDRNAILIIQNGGELRVSGLDFNGASENGIANGAILTQNEPAIEHYNLFIDDCSFYNFNEGKVTAIQAFKSTFADSIVISNSIFHTISGMGLNLKAEIEDLGKYNAEYVILKNCLFYNIMGSAIDLYRGGNDESTTGPSLQVDQCTFYNVENKELGSTIILTGVQDIRITNSIFSNSGKSGRVIHLEDQGWIQCHIDHNVFHNCGRFESFYDNRLGKNNLYLDPGFFSVENADFRLDESSKLYSSQKNITIPGYKQL
ncbi:TonB-dependent receptor, partial [Bacteroidota bacterium]